MQNQQMRNLRDQEVQDRLNQFWTEIAPVVLDEATDEVDKPEMHDC